MKIKFYTGNLAKYSNQQSSLVRRKAFKSMLFLGLLLLVSIGEMQAGSFYQNMLQQLKICTAETLIEKGNVSEQNINHLLFNMMAGASLEIAEGYPLTCSTDALISCQLSCFPIEFSQYGISSTGNLSSGGAVPNGATGAPDGSVVFAFRDLPAEQAVIEFADVFTAEAELTFTVIRDHPVYSQGFVVAFSEDNVTYTANSAEMNDFVVGEFSDINYTIPSILTGNYKYIRIRGAGSSANVGIDAIKIISEECAMYTGYAFGDSGVGASMGGVYDDGVQNGGEHSMNLTTPLYANVIQGGMVVYSAPFDNTGYYRIPTLPDGNYDVVLTDDPMSITSSLPFSIYSFSNGIDSYSITVVNEMVTSPATIPAFSYVGCQYGTVASDEYAAIARGGFGHPFGDRTLLAEGPPDGQVLYAFPGGNSLLTLEYEESFTAGSVISITARYVDGRDGYIYFEASTDGVNYVTISPNLSGFDPPSGSFTTQSFTIPAGVTDLYSYLRIDGETNETYLAVDAVNIFQEYCYTCSAGLEAPILSSTLVTNTCPTETVDLSTVTASNALSNTTLTWHTGTPATSANLVSSPATVAVGTYYAAFYHAGDDCYSRGNAELIADIDTDCDGISDMIDIDDDNDGVLDLEECPVDFPCGTGTVYYGQFTNPTNNTATYPDGAPSCTNPLQTCVDGQEFFGTVDINGSTQSYTFSAERNAIDSPCQTDGTDDNGIGIGVNWLSAGYHDMTLEFDQPTAMYIDYNSLGSGTHPVTLDIIVDGVSVMQEYGAELTGGFCIPRIIHETLEINMLSRDCHWTHLRFGFYDLNEFGVITSCDIDNDGILNRLDTDSDNDGCYDSYEAGVTGATSNGSITDSLAATTMAEVGANGFANNLETAEDGVYTGTYTYSQATDGVSVCPVPCTDPNFYGATCDFDGDGINNEDDLDDDNDGILDTDECATASPISNFESGPSSDYANGIFDYTSTGLQGPITTDDGTEFYVQLSSPGLGFGDGMYDGVNVYGASNQTVSFTDGSSNPVALKGFVFYFTDVEQLPFNEYIEEVVLSLQDGTTVTYNSTNGWAGFEDVNGNEVTDAGTLLVENGSGLSNNVLQEGGGQDGKYIKFDASSLAITGIEVTFTPENFLGFGFDDSQLMLVPSVVSCDIDNDGITNNFDLDSDNDGCYDSYEAGVTGATANGSITDSLAATTMAEVSANGFADALETAEDGIATYTSTYSANALDDAVNMCPQPCTDPNLFADNCDFDGDGVNNIDDIDDDNDGILDTEEQACINSIVNPGNSNYPNGSAGDLGTWEYSKVSTISNSNDNIWGTDPHATLLTNYPIRFTAEYHADQINYSDAYISTNGPDPSDINHPLEFWTAITAANGFNYLNMGTFENVVIGPAGDPDVDFIESARKVITTDLEGEYTIAVNGNHTWNETTGDSDEDFALLINDVNVILPRGSNYGTSGVATYTITLLAGDILELRSRNLLCCGGGMMVSVLSYVEYNCAFLDTDNDGIADQFDLDSDGDGCPDAVEAFVAPTTDLMSANVTNGNGVDATANTTTSTVDAQLDPNGTDANNDGLNDSVDSAQDGMTDYDSEYANYGLNNSINACLDSDNDGIADIVDIDDDNDGIRDSEESPDCFYAAADFESGDRRAFVTATTELGFWAGNEHPEELLDGDNGTSTASYAVRFQNNNMENKEVFRFSFLHPIELSSIYLHYATNSTVFAHGVFLKLQGSNDVGETWADLNTSSQYDASTGNSAVPNQGSIFNHSFIVTQNAGAYKDYRIYCVSGYSSETGVLVETYFETNNIVAENLPRATCSTDTDNDGILNHLDLDSDGDGCSDAYEAGATTNTVINYQFPTTNVGANGLEDSLEGSPEDGVINYTSTYDTNALDDQIATCCDPNDAAADCDMDGNPNGTDPDDTAGNAVADSDTAPVGSATTIDILVNDDFLDNNDSANLGTTTITDAGTGNAGGTIAFDPSTGELMYTPLASEEGTDVTVDYQVCNTDPTPDVCDIATVTITVIEEPCTDPNLYGATCDFDSDGVNNRDDLDDDNDGVLDSEEACVTVTSSSQSGGVTGKGKSHGTIETAGTTATTDNSAWMAAGDVLTITLDSEIPVGGKVTFSLADRNGSGALTITDEGTGSLVIANNDFTTEDMLQYFEFTVTAASDVFVLTRNAGQVWVDGVIDCDTDDDGIDNRFDLDSDGDGCYDSFEVGVTGATNDGSVTDSLAATTMAEVGNNGFTNSLESDDTNAAAANYTATYANATDGVSLCNEAPEITNHSSDPNASQDYAENGTADVIDWNATDADGDTENGGGLTYALTGADAALFTIDSATGVLTWNASPDFETPMDADTDNAYEVIVTVFDSNGGTDVQALTINVTDVNDAPVITSDGGGATASVNAAENQTAATTVSAPDPDIGDVLTFSIIGGIDENVFMIAPSTGELVFNTAPDFENPTDEDMNNVYEVEVQVCDVANLCDTQFISVTVTDVNEAPMITSDGGGDTAAVSVAENQTAVTTATSTDVDAGDTQTYSVSGGADSALFTVNSTTGELVFATAPDFENPADANTDNVYEVEITVTDTAGLTDVQTISVTVTDVDEDGDGFTGTDDPDDNDSCVPNNADTNCCEAAAPTITKD